VHHFPEFFGSSPLEGEESGGGKCRENNPFTLTPALSLKGEGIS
jgi:hypothetical protein